MATVTKFVQIVPPIEIDGTHNNAPYTVYPSMHVPELTFLYICSDTCGVSIYTTDGCPHPDDHRKHICKVVGEEADVNSWISTNNDKVTDLTAQQADALGKVLAPERPGVNEEGSPITIPECDINDWL